MAWRVAPFRRVAAAYGVAYVLCKWVFSHEINVNNKHWFADDTFLAARYARKMTAATRPDADCRDYANSREKADFATWLDGVRF